MWFGKAVEDFNAAILEGGNGSPQLVAATANGFVSTYTYFRRCMHKLTKHHYSDLRRLCLLRCSISVLTGETPCDGNGQGSLSKIMIIFSTSTECMDSIMVYLDYFLLDSHRIPGNCSVCVTPPYFNC